MKFFDKKIGNFNLSRIGLGSMRMSDEQEGIKTIQPYMKIIMILRNYSNIKI